MEENAAPPIEDLSLFSDANDCTVAEKYLVVFNEQVSFYPFGDLMKQVKTNLGRLETLDPISKLSQFLKEVSSVSSSPYITLNVQERLDDLTGYLVSIKVKDTTYSGMTFEGTSGRSP
jgi:hypothetical protein